MRKKIGFIIVLAFFLIIFKYSKSNATEIPKVYLEGNIMEMNSKTDEREIFLKFSSDDVNFETFSKIKIQGNSSLAYDKKNYTINFYNDNTYSEKNKVDVGKGWGKQSKYCLKANWIDKTHSRNIVGARIAAQIQDKYNLFKNTPHNGTIDGFPVEIYINNEFLGLYTWNIPKDRWMWNMDKNNDNHIVIAGKKYTNSTQFEETVSGSLEEAGWECEVGIENEAIINKLNRLINFVNTSTDEEFINDFENYINKDCALNYLVMLYLMEADDNASKNMMLVTYDGEIWYPSLYDLDSTFGTYWNGEIHPQGYNYLPENGYSSKLWNRMLTNFPNEIVVRWFQFRNDIFDKGRMIEEFSNFINSIPTEVYSKEIERWGNNIPGQGIEQIDDFLNYRLPYIDDVMREKYTINSEIHVEYSKEWVTNENVIVTIVSNEEIKEIEGWTLSEDGKQLKKEFKTNYAENIIITNFAGIKSEVEIKISNIDKELPVINGVLNKEVYYNPVTINVIDDNLEMIQLRKQGVIIEGYQNGQTIEKKGIYIMTAKDLAGNINNIEFTIHTMRGDITGNELIDMGDVLMILRHIALNGSVSVKTKHPDWELDEIKQKIGDINKNNSIETGDTLGMLRYIAARESGQVRQQHPEWLNIN